MPLGTVPVPLEPGTRQLLVDIGGGTRLQAAV